MLRIHKRQIEDLSEKLQALLNAPEDLKLLHATQQQILWNILRAEELISTYHSRIRQIKRSLSIERKSKAGSISCKNRISKLKTLIALRKQMLFIWRSFGDGIAFIYLDKFALKQVLYNVDDPLEKSRSGNISGKEGLKMELKFLRKLLSLGIPAMLCDLSNCIRYGDVCILVGPDPFMIEVKTSSHKTARTRRQANNLRTIQEFFANDEAPKLRGLRNVRRAAVSSSEINYQSLFDEGISVAASKGYFKIDPELGMRFIALTSASHDVFAEVMSGFQPSIVHMLSEEKANHVWAPYYPFTLSIKNPHNLYSFLNGDVVVVVCFDFRLIAETAKSLGMSFDVDGDANYPFHCEYVNEIGSSVPINISSHMANRTVFELLSWRWLLETGRHYAMEQK